MEEHQTLEPIASLPKPVILLAENDPDYREATAKLLQAKGFQVLEAASPAMAIDLLTSRVDLAIVDLRLTRDGNPHDFSGLEMARRARERNIPCIIVTAYPTVETAKRALQERGGETLAVDFVRKKDGPEPLLRAIQGLRGITLLQIADLHLAPTLLLDQEQALQSLAADIAQQPGVGFHPVRGIVCCGDISVRAPEPDSFDQAYSLLSRLAANLGVPQHQVILVPGNHEVDRTRAGDGSTDATACRYDKLESFLRFSARFYGEPAFAGRERPYRIFHFREGLTVVALNSCVKEGVATARCPACPEEHYYGWLDPRDVTRAAEELDASGCSHLRIAVCHHHVIPDGWSGNANGCSGRHLRNYRDPAYRMDRQLFGAGFELLLHGHRHGRDLLQSDHLGAQVPCTLGCGRLWRTAEDGEAATYLLLQFSPYRGQSRIIVRKYHPVTNFRNGMWGPDEELGADSIIRLPERIFLKRRPDE